MHSSIFFYISFKNQLAAAWSDWWNSTVHDPGRVPSTVCKCSIPEPRSNILLVICVAI